MNFETIASGSAGNCYQIDDGVSHRLMIEAGVRKRVWHKGAPLSGLDGCLITHSHGDHSKGVGDLLKSGVDCYMSKGTVDAIGVNGHRVHVVTARKQFSVGAWTVLPFDTIHDAPESLGFLIQSEDGDKLLFATDTTCIKYRFKGLTHIAVECNYDAGLVREAVRRGDTSGAVAKRVYASHMSLQTVKRMLAVNDLSKVKEIHLLHLSDAHSDEDMFRREIERQTGKPVYIGESLHNFINEKLKETESKTDKK